MRFYDIKIYIFNVFICLECNSLECQCRPPYQIVNGECTLAGCNKEKCPAGAECVSIAGGVSYCACPKGYRPREDGSCYGIYSFDDNYLNLLGIDFGIHFF